MAPDARKDKNLTASTYASCVVGEGYSCIDPRLCYRDGRLYIMEQRLNQPSVPIDVTEQVAKAIAQYLTPSKRNEKEKEI